MTLIGHPSTWLLVALAWLGLSLIVSALVGSIARVGTWSARRRKEKGK
jgi:hypothetical protein